MRTKLLVGCLVPLLLVMVAACSKSDDGKSVASVSGTAAPTATPSLHAPAGTWQSVVEQGRRHAQCMRDHGVPEADPQINPDGSVRTGGGYDKHTLDQDVLDKAIEACKQYKPVLPPDVMAKKLEGAREEARCMRAHGVESFPDPDPNDLGKSLPDAVRDDPQYEQAKEVCSARPASASPRS